MAWGSFLGGGDPRTNVPPDLTNVVAIAAGNGHGVAVESDGSVWAWGLNNLGQLGDGTITNRSAPIPVAGLTGVTGCGFGSDGQFYATEFSVEGWESFKENTGAVVRVAPHSTGPTVVAGGLTFPNGFAADAHGAIYVSNWSIAPANSGGGPTGEVVRITP